MHLDGYKYWLAYKKGTKSYFRCSRSKSQKCPGKIIMESAKVLTIIPHDHDKESRNNAVEKFRKVLTKKAVEKPNKSLVDIYLEETLNHSEASILYPFSQAESTMRKARRKSEGNGRKNGEKIENCAKSEKQVPNRNCQQHQKYFYVENLGEGMKVILMNQGSLKVLGKIDEIHVDCGMRVDVRDKSGKLLNEKRKCFEKNENFEHSPTAKVPEDRTYFQSCQYSTETQDFTQNIAENFTYSQESPENVNFCHKMDLTEASAFFLSDHPQMSSFSVQHFESLQYFEENSCEIRNQQVTDFQSQKSFESDVINSNLDVTSFNEQNSDDFSAENVNQMQNLQTFVINFQDNSNIGTKYLATIDDEKRQTGNCGWNFSNFSEKSLECRKKTDEFEANFSKNFPKINQKAGDDEIFKFDRKSAEIFDKNHPNPLSSTANVMASSKGFLEAQEFSSFEMDETRIVKNLNQNEIARQSDDKSKSPDNGGQRPCPSLTFFGSKTHKTKQNQQKSAQISDSIKKTQHNLVTKNSTNSAVFVEFPSQKSPKILNFQENLQKNIPVESSSVHSYHIITIIALIKGRECPIAFGLLKSPNFDSFSHFLQLLVHKIQLNPATILTNENPVIHQSIHTIWPESTIKVMYFHYAKSVLKNFSEISKNIFELSSLKMILSMPLIPTNYVIPGWEALRKWMSEKNVDLNDVCDIVYVHWLAENAERISIFNGLTHTISNHTQVFQSELLNSFGDELTGTDDLTDKICRQATKSFIKFTKMSESLAKKIQKLQKTVKIATKNWISSPFHLRRPIQFLQQVSHCIDDGMINFVMNFDGNFVETKKAEPPPLVFYAAEEVKSGEKKEGLQANKTVISMEPPPLVPIMR